MIGLGTVINVSAIIIGGILGLLFQNKLTNKIQESLTLAIGTATLFLGISGALEIMLDRSGLTTMLILSLAIGTLLGELIDIEAKFEQFGKWLKIKTNNAHDSKFLDAFITTSLTVCIGAMAIVGSIQDGMQGDYSLLMAKAILDFIIVMIFASSLGKGCLFSFIPVGVFQGSITLLASFIQPIMTETALSNLSLIGSILIFLVGVNLVWDKKIRISNMLPAIIVAIVFAFI